MNDQDYFSHLYEIARHLNNEFALQSALHKSLEKTVEILDIETGWIWLTEPDLKSVYLAASYNLPPALRNYPERLSGWCYCIKQYLSEDIDQAVNISEIACSRLKEISRGTKDLKFHATIPITIKGQKVGLMNLLSKETRQLDKRELNVLNTISLLVGAAIQRTRMQQSFRSENNEKDTAIRGVMERVFEPQIEAIISLLDDPKYNKAKVDAALKRAKDLQEQISMLRKESIESGGREQAKKEFRYPNLPLSKRELEVLTLIKKGHTNGQIGKQLFISERTVKFHVTSILSKLNAATRTEAVDISLKRGLLCS